MFCILVLVVYVYYYANSYTGVNAHHCIYCKTIPGKHIHYVGPTTIIWGTNNASTHVPCNTCQKYPGQYHFHKSF